MMTQKIVLEFPNGAFSALRTSPTEFGQELRIAAAAKWYELGRLSQGKAAELAGLSRAEFIDALGRYGVSALQESVSEIAEGLARDE